MAEHTAGLFRVNPISPIFIEKLPGEGKNDLVAVAVDPNFEEAKKHATLLAAAPRLLYALRDLYTLVETFGDVPALDDMVGAVAGETFYHALVEAADALAEAEGR